MKYLKNQYRLLVYFTSLTVCSGDIKLKKKLVIFKAFFFRSPDPKSEKNTVNQLIKKICP